MTKLKIRKLFLKLKGDEEEENNRSLMALLKFFHGNTPVCLYNESEDRTIVVHKDYWVHLTECLIAELKARLGDDCVKIV